MARRRTDRSGSIIWPGFVDAMTALLLVLMFVLSIFMIVQFVLREELTGKDRSLAELNTQLTLLSEQLSVSERDATRFRAEVSSLNELLALEREQSQELRDELVMREVEGERLAADLASRLTEITALTTRLEARQSALDEATALAALLQTERDQAEAQLIGLRDAQTQLTALADANAALEADLAAAQSSLAQQTSENAALADQLDEARADAASASDNATAETAALRAEIAAATAEVDSLRGQAETLGADVQAAQEQTAAERARADAAEAARLTADEEKAALNAQLAEIRRRLAEAAGRTPDQPALTITEQIAALELALDQRRREAEEALTLLAAAEAKGQTLSDEARAAAARLSERQRLNAFAAASLAGQQAVGQRDRLAVALLNQQVADLRAQVAGLREQLDASEAREEESQVVIENLGARLNRALAEKVSELQRYRSEFFGRLRDILGERDDVRIVGDRFVFQAEVLFESGSADLGDAGRDELAQFASALRQLSDEIPTGLNWILRVDGHTDVVPLGPNSEYDSNWELSTARALSVVNYLIDDQGFPSTRLAATGFGEFQPIAEGRSTDALARNRRIELKLTER